MEESYFGSYEVLGADSNGAEPDQAPDVCSLCSLDRPRWWYEIEPTVALPGHASEMVAYARWAIRDACNHLLPTIGQLAERVAKTGDQEAVQVLPRFGRRALLWGEITPA